MKNIRKKQKTFDSFDEIQKELIDISNCVEDELTKLEKLIMSLEKKKEMASGHQNTGFNVPVFAVANHYGTDVYMAESSNCFTPSFGNNFGSIERAFVPTSFGSNPVVTPLPNSSGFGSFGDATPAFGNNPVTTPFGNNPVTTPFGNSSGFGSFGNSSGFGSFGDVSEPFEEKTLVPKCNHCNNFYSFSCIVIDHGTWKCSDCNKINKAANNCVYTYFKNKFPVVKRTPAIVTDVEDCYSEMPTVLYRHKFIYVEDYVLINRKKHVWVVKHLCKTALSGYRCGHYRQIEK
jgi:ribosomal protein L37AE/L43A